MLRLVKLYRTDKKWIGVEIGSHESDEVILKDCRVFLEEGTPVMLVASASDIPDDIEFEIIERY